MRVDVQILTVFLLVTIIGIFVTACTKKEEVSNSTIRIITTIFPQYDFARAVSGDHAMIKMLLKPGAESHSFDPSPQDNIDIQNCDLFIYTGGENDIWVSNLLSGLDTDKIKVIRLLDCIKPKEEELVAGMEKEEGEETEYDEHVWTSPKNAIILVNAIRDALIEIDEEHVEEYMENAKKYTDELLGLDVDFKQAVNAGVRRHLVFADRFPFRYFADEYGLTYSAAFPGCATETEPSVKTITYLIQKIRDEKIPVVFYIEFSNQKIAKSIQEETGVKALLFHSTHNISQLDFGRGITYIDLMRTNLEHLKEALR